MQGMQRKLKEEFGRDFRDEQIHRLGYREQFREHEGKMTHRIAFYHLTLLSGEEKIQNMEPDKHSELRYFLLDSLPVEDKCHSMLYPTLTEFKEKIEQLTGKKIIF